MASTDVTFIADLDFRKADATARKAFQRLDQQSRKSAQGLGFISASADNFTRSLEASNARVIAFGASVAVIEVIRKSFVNLVKTITDVEKQLISTNSILGRSSSGIQQLGKEFFAIAKNTGQSFDEVAKTAQEFARQGLSVEQTLKRTNDALILTRLTTLNSDKAIEGLTATLNGFSKAGLSSEKVINKLRAVETSFAVSSGDLIEALARSSSVAQDAGVSFDELLGLITAIKQRTGLAAATIGQGLKAAFVRLNLPERIAKLKELGVNIDTSSNGLERLRQVSIDYSSALSNGNKELATQIGSIAAGQHQISKLSAAFADLGNSNSIAVNATKTSLEANGEAIKANQAYNDSINAVANSIKQNFSSIFASIGNVGGTDAIKNLLADFNVLLEAVQGNKISTNNVFVALVRDALAFADEIGVLTGVAKGFLNVLQGPAAVVAVSAILNLVKNTVLQGGKSLLTLTGINKRSVERAKIQEGINLLLSQANGEELKNFNLATSQKQQQEIILRLMERQLAVQSAQVRQGAALAESFRAQGLNLSASGAGIAFSRSRNPIKGGTRNFASGTIEAIQKEQSAIASGVGGASSNAQIQIVPRFNAGNGKVGPAVINSDEILIPSRKGDIVLTKDMLKNSGVENYAIGASRALSIQARLSSGKTLTPKQLADVQNNIEQIKRSFPALYEEVIDSSVLQRQRALTAGGGGLGQSSRISQPRRPSTQASSSSVASGALRSIQAQNTTDQFFGGKDVSGEFKRLLINNGIESQVEQLRKSSGDKSITQETLQKSPKGRQLLKEFQRKAAAPIVQQQKAIRAQLADSALKTAILELDKESRGKISIKGLKLPSVNRGLESALSTKGLSKQGRSVLQSQAADLKATRGQKITQGAFFGSIAGSFLAPLAGKGAEKVSGNEQVGRATEGLITGASSGAALGSLFGPTGVAIGVIGGGLAGLVTNLGDAQTEVEKLTANFENLKEKNKDTSDSLSRYIQNQAKFNELIDSGNESSPEAQLVKFQLSEDFAALPNEIQKALIKAGADITKQQEVAVSEITRAIQEEKAALKEIDLKSLFTGGGKIGQVASTFINSQINSPLGLGGNFGQAPASIVSAGQQEFSRLSIASPKQLKENLKPIVDGSIQALTAEFQNFEDVISKINNIKELKDQTQALREILKLGGFKLSEKLTKNDSSVLVNAISESILGNREKFLDILRSNEQLNAKTPTGEANVGLDFFRDQLGINVGASSNSNIFGRSLRQLQDKEGRNVTQQEFLGSERAFGLKSRETIGSILSDPSLNENQQSKLQSTFEKSVRDTKGEKNVSKRLDTILSALQKAIERLNINAPGVSAAISTLKAGNEPNIVNVGAARNDIIEGANTPIVNKEDISQGTVGINPDGTIVNKGISQGTVGINPDGTSVQSSRKNNPNFFLNPDKTNVKSSRKNNPNFFLNPDKTNVKSSRKNNPNFFLNPDGTRVSPLREPTTEIVDKKQVTEINATPVVNRGISQGTVGINPDDTRVSPLREPITEIVDKKQVTGITDTKESIDRNTEVVSQNVELAKEILTLMKQNQTSGKTVDSRAEALIRYVIEGANTTPTETNSKDEVVRSFAERIDNIERILQDRPPAPDKTL